MSQLLFDTKKTIISHLSHSISPEDKFPMPSDSKYEYYKFVYELFSVYEKVPSDLHHAGFFFKHFMVPHPVQPKDTFLLTFII